MTGDVMNDLLPRAQTQTSTAKTPRTLGRWPIAASAVGLLALSALGVRWWLGPRVTTDTVHRREFVQAVVATGRVESPHRVDIGVQIIGTVVRVPVTDGQAVKAGERLVELESAELSASGKQADIAVTQARARLRQLQEVQGPVAMQTLRQAEATLANARSALARSQRLYDQGLVTRTDLDDATRAAQLADAQVRLTQKQLDTTGPSGSDRALALANVAAATANVSATLARSSYAVVTAPVAGTLIGRNVEVGDVVQPGRILMTLSPEGRTQVVVSLDEKHLGRLVVGQPALVSPDAYPALRLPARLVYINPGVDPLTGQVEIKLDVDGEPALLKQNMTVSVDIEVARRPRALLVSLASVHDAETAAPWVLRVERRRAIRTPIRLGLRAGGVAEVLDGLGEGNQVIPVTAPVAAGARVRAVALPTPRD